MILTIGWFSIFSGIWFWCIDKASTLISLKKDAWFITIWLFVTILYIWFLVKGSLFICGVCEGYSFFNPFIPLAHYKELVWCLYYVGVIGGLIFLILFQIFIVLGFVQRSHYLLYAIVCLIPFILGYAFYKPLTPSLSYTCFIKPWWYKSKDPIFVGYRMVHAVTQAMHNDSKLQTIIMPESAFGGDLHQYEEFVPMLTEYSSNVNIVFGGQRKIWGEMRNSCFMICDGNIKFVYDKIHLMPLVERIPTLCKIFKFQTLLNPTGEVFSYPREDLSDVLLLQGKPFQLFLCSELYFEAKQIKGMPILFLANDYWFYLAYVKRLSYLFLDYISLYYQVPIMYCTVEGCVQK